MSTSTRWAPRRVGAEGFVTLIIDLTPTYDQTGPARLIDQVPGRSAAALADWLAAQPADFAAGIEVVAMDGFAGYKTAAADVVPDAVTVMDPFHVVALAGAKLDLIRQRIQQQTLGRRGHTGDPLYGIRRVARTRIQLLSVRQYPRLTSVLDADEQIAVKLAYVIYQKIIAAYADPDRRRGKRVLAAVIDSIRRGVPAGLRRSPNSAAPYGADATTSSRSSTTTPPTDPPKPSTAAWKPYAATPSDSGISPIIESAHYSAAAHSTHSSMYSELRRAGLTTGGSLAEMPAGGDRSCRASVASFSPAPAAIQSTHAEAGRLPELAWRRPRLGQGDDRALREAGPPVPARTRRQRRYHRCLCADRRGCRGVPATRERTGQRWRG